MNKLVFGNINIFFFVLIIISLYSCSQKNISYKTRAINNINAIPDYSNIQYWAAHPWKWDPADSIPEPLRKNQQKDTIADVFFIHPTTLVDFNDGSRNASVDDSVLNEKTDYSTILYQASVFNEQSRVFAPRYRQAHLRTFYTSDKKIDSTAMDRAYSDVKNAFAYYLLHFNNGRPIIIAAHSQGTAHAGKLLKEFFEGHELKKLLVCAYIIGMPIPDSYFNELKPCKDSVSTGCFVGWRTYKRDYYDTLFVKKENFKSYTTNPLTWTLTEEYASTSLNTGGVLTNFNKISKGVVDAQIKGNVLWTCKPKFFGNIFLTKKNYHVGDINLFYTNIRNNVRLRLKMFLQQ